MLNRTLDELVDLNISDDTLSYEERMLLTKFKKLDKDNQRALLLSIDVKVAITHAIATFLISELILVSFKASPCLSFVRKPVKIKNFSPR